MKNTTCIVVLVMNLILASAPAMAATRVFLLGGQSNMSGVGGYPGDTGYPAAPLR